MEELIRRLARSCAHGHRQMGFVNELLAGVGYREYNAFDHLMYGDTKMQHSSWRTLRKRLVDNGFIVKLGDRDRSGRRQPIEMRFSA